MPNIGSVLKKSKNAILYLARSNKAGVQSDGQNGALVAKFGHDFMDILYIQDTLNAGIGILLACRGGKTTLGLAHGFKGQIISDCLFDVFKFPKKPTKNLTNFCPQNLKSGQIIKDKGTIIH